ncbi:MAG: hypothetical protein DHS20C18_37240 [Saprospiraceae bacterium]|nr:MAG: hypothetical protein DHS20C18_37240 [Saprospiraceae bacterium]
MQQLFILAYDEASDQTMSQFLVRRFRLKFGGFVFTPDLEYKVELGLSNRDISVDKEDGNTRDAARIIFDAVLKWKFAKNWALWVGQTKLPGNRERVISSGSLQFVDRSLLNSAYNIDRDAGLQLRGKFDLGNTIIAPSFSISQGEGRNITSTNAGGYDYTAHVDFLPLGEFSNKGDFISADLEREQSPKLAIGLTYDYNDGAVRQGGQLGNFVQDSLGNYVENSLSTFFIDLMFKYQGFSLLSEYANKSAAHQIEDISKGFLTGTGFTAQVGYLFNNNLEIALRYTNLRREDDLSAISDEDQYTLGVSKYIVDHNLKVQGDITRSTFPDISDGAYQFRMQVEMQF